jgi:hypothetical protein
VAGQVGAVIGMMIAQGSSDGGAEALDMAVEAAGILQLG